MKIAVCFKIIPEETGITINDDKTLDISKASLEISTYDCNAMEAAARVAAGIDGCEFVAITAGGEKVENSKMKKAALSRGPTALYAVKNDKLDNADACTVALALKGEIEKLGIDLVICGEGSGDMYSQQTGNLLGAMMGIPAVNAVSKIEYTDGKLRVERTIEDGTEILDLSLPAVLTVTSDIVPAKIPSMKDIMGAGKKPVTMESADAVGTEGVRTVSVLAPEQTDRRKIVVKGDSEESIAEFYENIRRLIV